MHDRTHYGRPAGRGGALPRRPNAAPPAFTLVEMLVVILIIGILLGTLLPTLAKVRVAILVRYSQATINRVHGAIQEYYGDHDVYPASANALVKAVATAWQKRARGTYYGPYNGTDRLGYRNALKAGETDPDSATGDSMFHDAFGNPILYYRFRPDPEKPNGGDYDEGGVSGVACGVPPNLNAYLKGEGQRYFRADFVLISRGVNEAWDAPYVGGWTQSDDLSNFLEQ